MKTDGTRIDLFAHTVKLLIAGPRTVADLVEMVGCHEVSAYRYVNALAGHGLIEGKKRQSLNGPRPIVWRWKP